MAKKATNETVETSDKPEAADPDVKAKPKADAPKEKDDRGKPEQSADKKAKPSPPKAAKQASAPEKKKSRRPGDGPRRGKKLRQQLKNQRQKAKKEGAVSLDRAITILKQMSRAKFDETVEVHVKLGIDPTQSDQMIRGAVSLPNGVGKDVRVVVFCQGDNVEKATEAGADHAGSDEIIQKIQKDGWLEFDVALATQDMMAQVSRLGKVLGPRGLMPSPKAGTVIKPDIDVGDAVKEFKAGKVEYRSDRTGNVHAGIGKLSFENEKLQENAETFINQIRAVKPAGVKGLYVRTITLAATMTPGVPVSA